MQLHIALHWCAHLMSLLTTEPENQISYKQKSHRKIGVGLRCIRPKTPSTEMGLIAWETLSPLSVSKVRQWVYMPVQGGLWSSEMFVAACDLRWHRQNWLKQRIYFFCCKFLATNRKVSDYFNFLLQKKWKKKNTWISFKKKRKDSYVFSFLFSKGLCLKIQQLHAP